MLLSLNAGSSSLKVALFAADGAADRMLAFTAERLGSADAALHVRERDGRETRTIRLEDGADFLAAWKAIRRELEKTGHLKSLRALGHRFVHGGARHQAPTPVTRELLEELRGLAALDPQHLPAEISLAEHCLEELPGLPALACFDTAFHRTLPRVAQLLPVPHRFFDQGVRRYGFHGLSYAFLVEELARIAGPDVAQGRLVLAHLGSGASLAAVQGGRSIETTMGFTPNSGLPMGTRSGDLDPGFAGYCAEHEQMSAHDFQALTNRQSGLLGLSGTSADIRDLLARESSDPHAADALGVFCHRIRQQIGALAATLGGLDTLVFAGGIGENAAAIRARITAGLGFLGVELDPARNTAHAAVISRDGVRVTVRIMRTDEERMIARELQRWLHPLPSPASP